MANNILNERCPLLDGIMFHGKQCGSCVGICLWCASYGQQLSAPLAICSHSVLVSNVFHHDAVYFKAMCISV
jgi:hypothetical protein